MSDEHTDDAQAEFDQKQAAYFADLQRLTDDFQTLIGGRRIDIVISALAQHLSEVIGFVSECPVAAYMTTDNISTGIKHAIQLNWDRTRAARAKAANNFPAPDHGSKPN